MAQEIKRGEIVKVSGPLVIARNLGNAKIYDLVKVGEQKLMGEIIEMRGEEFFIQVYEETIGLGPGDHVYATGEPLSVQLGPGILSSIYDGVQRPLDIIKAKYGNFISRGLEEPGISLSKKWPFEPRVAPGDTLKAGDILGVVKETAVIEHRIMLPPGLEGVVKEIFKGEFTVEEPVAVINTNGLDHPVTMLQKWPVRKARPYQKKLPPDTPLITGQRVIDSFFPMTKGGTASIPGPFGSGKCVSGETPVMLCSGEITQIKQIFAEYKDKGQKVENKREEYTILDNPLEVFSYLQGNVVKNRATAVYRGKTERLLKITTRTGRIAKVTPIHKLFRVNGDLIIERVMAKSLKKGDYLASPRVLDFAGFSQTIPVFDIFRDCRVAETEILQKISSLIDKLRRKFGTLRKLAEVLEINYSVLGEYYRQRNRPTLNFVKKLCDLAGDEVPNFTFIKGERQSKRVRIPDQLDAQLAGFLGLLWADGSLKTNSVRFYNNSEEIQELFEKLATNIFGLSAKWAIANTVTCSIIESKVLGKLLKFFGYPEFQKSRNCFAPKTLLSSPAETIGAFLGAYFVGDGFFHFQKGEIEFSTASKRMQQDLAYLLLRLGILNRLKKRKSKGFLRYGVFISGRGEVEKFCQLCGSENLRNIYKFRRIEKYLKHNKNGYTSVDVVPIMPRALEQDYNKANRPYARLKRKGVEIHNYLSGELMSKKMFEKFTQEIEDERLVAFANNHLEHIYCDKIVEIEEVNEPQEVYDLEVPRGHNFIGGSAPMFYSNTVVQHQISKWANSEIVVFIGCGERGNEMTDVLIEFPKLTDPNSGKPLMERTILIANTSNMPVAAREASIYTGITIAEYFRDMGYNVALQADSTSRWAEALREISGRLEEMPGEEGFPAYLGTRLASFYERAGKVVCAGHENRVGTITVIGSVSPPGGDLSEPVVQNTLRVVKVFWALEDKLAYERHYPAVNWLVSYSLYKDKIKDYWTKKVDSEFGSYTDEAMGILQEEAELREVVRLVGVEALSYEEQLLLETARSIREDFLQQSAFHEVDTFTSLKKQFLMLKSILTFHAQALEAIKKGTPLSEIISFPVRARISRLKYAHEEKMNFEALENEIIESFRRAVPDLEEKKPAEQTENT